MSLARNFLFVGSGAALSRVLGFVRDILIAASLGAGPVADAFVVAFRLPNLFRRLLAEGAMNTAFLPIYLKLRTESGAGAAQAFAGQVFSVLALMVLAFVSLAEMFMPSLVHLMAPGFFAEPDQASRTILLSRLTFPFLGFSLLSAVYAALLNGAERFFITAFAPVLLNLVMIAMLGLAFSQGFAGSLQMAVFLCAGVSLAGVFQLTGGWFHLRRAGLGIGWHGPRLSPEIRRLGLYILPGMFAGGITQINAFVGSFIGSASPGVVAQLYYADRIYQLPLGIVSMALGQTLLSQIARLLAQGDARGAVLAQARALEFALFLTLPASVGLYVAANPIVSVLFERGAFGADSTLATAGALQFYALGLPAFVMAKALQPMFFAAHQMRVPTLIAVLGAVLDVVCAYLMFASLLQSGIALAAALAGWFNAMALAVVLWHSGRLELGRDTASHLFCLALSALVMGGVVWILGVGLAPYFQAAQSSAVKILALAALVCGGAMVFLASCWRLGCLNVRDWKARV